MKKEIFAIKEIMEEDKESAKMDKKEILGQEKETRPVLVVTVGIKR